MKQKPLPPLMIVQKLKKAKSDKQIDKIIKEAWERDSQEFFLALQFSMDKNLKFLISKAPLYEDETNESSNYSFDDFFKLVSFVKNSKNISIEEIKDLVRKHAESSNPIEWNQLYRKVILKKFHADLPINGIIKSLNQLINPNNVTMFTKNTNNIVSDSSEIIRKKI